jgi:hypothetical protein
MSIGETWTTRREYSPDRFRRLAEAAPAGSPYGERAERLCEALAGSPYRVDPLGGAPGEPEALSVSLSAFDCVTFVEEVTAFAASTSEEDFLARLRRIRYEQGQVDYFRRRHYFSQWLSGNAAEGQLALLEIPGLPHRVWPRTLSVLPALGPQPASVRGWPKTSFPRLRPQVRSGDVAAFVSTRRDLDYFHTGLLIVRGSSILLAHAARSAGAVVIVPLPEFLRAGRMSGLTVARPWPDRPDVSRPQEARP